jgi:hypothetical protein
MLANRLSEAAGAGSAGKLLRQHADQQAWSPMRIRRLHTAAARLTVPVELLRQAARHRARLLLTAAPRPLRHGTGQHTPLKMHWLVAHII